MSQPESALPYFSTFVETTALPEGVDEVLMWNFQVMTLSELVRGGLWDSLKDNPRPLLEKVVEGFRKHRDIWEGIWDEEKLPQLEQVILQNHPHILGTIERLRGDYYQAIQEMATPLNMPEFARAATRPNYPVFVIV